MCTTVLHRKSREGLPGWEHGAQDEAWHVLKNVCPFLHLIFLSTCVLSCMLPCRKSREGLPGWEHTAQDEAWHVLRNVCPPGTWEWPPRMESELQAPSLSKSQQSQLQPHHQQHTLHNSDAPVQPAATKQQQPQPQLNFMKILDGLTREFGRKMEIEATARKHRLEGAAPPTDHVSVQRGVRFV